MALTVKTFRGQEASDKYLTHFLSFFDDDEVLSVSNGSTYRGEYTSGDGYDGYHHHPAVTTNFVTVTFKCPESKIEDVESKITLEMQRQRKAREKAERDKRIEQRRLLKEEEERRREEWRNKSFWEKYHGWIKLALVVLAFTTFLHFFTVN